MGLTNRDGDDGLGYPILGPDQWGNDEEVIEFEKEAPGFEAFFLAPDHGATGELPSIREVNETFDPIGECLKDCNLKLEAQKKTCQNIRTRLNQYLKENGCPNLIVKTKATRRKRCIKRCKKI